MKASDLAEEQREGRKFQEEKVQLFKRRWEEKQDQVTFEKESPTSPGVHLLG